MLQLFKFLRYWTIYTFVFYKNTYIVIVHNTFYIIRGDLMKSLKKFLALSLMLCMAFVMTACGGGDKKAEEEKKADTAATEDTKTDAPKADFHIGIVTGTVSQSEDELRAAQKAIELYGNAKDGGMIVHDTYPDNFMNEQETTISKIVAMADDPQMKAIIVNQSVPGTVAAFKQIREKNPEIKLIDLTPQEDVAMVQEAADLVIDADNISRGYRVIAAAKAMGATKFVHISFPRHMSIEMLALRRGIFEEACKDLGVEFISETAPDPTSDVGIPGAQQFIAENIPNWIEKYGKENSMSLDNWRMQNVNTLICKVYRTIKSVDSSVEFGISPQGNIGNNDGLYADVKSWCTCKGFADYICPQIYFSLENPALTFEDCLNSWTSLDFDENVKLYVGLGGYKAGNGEYDEETWLLSDSILADEYDILRNNKSVRGFMLYSYSCLEDDTAKKEINNLINALN